MASRAHVIHDYSFDRRPPPVRQRRSVWMHTDEEVVLPRSRNFSGGGALFVSALAATALTAGLTYAVYVGDVPALTLTEATPLVRDWEPDPGVLRATVTNQLSGPAFAVPSRGGPITLPEDGWADVPLTSAGESSTLGSFTSSGSSETPANDSASGLSPAPIQEPLPNKPDAPGAQEHSAYPDPTTTPPEGFAPASPQPEPAAPVTVPDNPYTD